MSKNKAGLNMRLQMLLRRVKKLCQKPPLMLAALLFVISIAIPPVVAQAPQVTTSVQSQQGVFGLIKQGRTLYQEGNYQQAAEVLEQAADTFKQQGNKVNQAMALSNLSLIYQQLGRWDDAKEAISTSLNVLQSQPKTQDSLRIYAQTLDIQGKLKLNIGQSAEALETWQQATKIYAQIPDKDGVTQSLINQAQAMQDLGLYPRACNTLINVLDIDIEKIGKAVELELEKIGKDLKLNLQDCQSLTKLNTTELEIFTIQLISSLNQKPDSQLKFNGLRSLGEVFQVAVGNLEESKKILEASKELAERLKSSQNQADAYLSLGNITISRSEAKAKKNTLRPNSYKKEANLYYKEAARLSKSPDSIIVAQFNQLNILVQLQEWKEVQDLWLPLKQKLNQLSPSRKVIYAQINFANSWITLKKQKDLSLPTNIQLPTLTEIDKILINANNQAKSLGDKQTEAYAIGNRGFLYELLYEKSKNLKNLDNSLKYTNEALSITSIQSSEITYQMLWQLGRIYKAQGNIKSAISAYTKAFNILQTLSKDLVASNTKNQFYFRTIVEPIYRQLVELDLELAQQTTDNQDLLKQARQVIESLQLAELNNFFRAACLNARTQQIDTFDKNAAVIYPIILKNQLQVILSLPVPDSQQILSVETPQQDNKPITQKQIEQTAQEFLDTLKPENSRDHQRLDILSQQLYQWLIKPLEAKLKSSKVKTLVFVLDGKLKNIPMAALKKDKDNYLINDYAIALTPGLQLLEPKPLIQIPIKVFTAGLSKGRFDAEEKKHLEPLYYVKTGLEKLKDMGIAGEPLLDEKFTNKAFRDKVIASSLPMVYLATHGQFGTSFEDTYIYTWDDKININQLNELLRNNIDGENKPIELLVLSACETASGDEQTALGLAGIAVRAGARSTIGTLWQVPDESSSELMVKFYSELQKAKNENGKVNKAEALSKAQLSLLKNEKFKEPYNWAAFVLLGNWL